MGQFRTGLRDTNEYCVYTCSIKKLKICPSSFQVPFPVRVVVLTGSTVV